MLPPPLPVHCINIERQNLREAVNFRSQGSKNETKQAKKPTGDLGLSETGSAWKEPKVQKAGRTWNEQRRFSKDAARQTSPESDELRVRRRAGDGKSRSRSEQK